MEKENFEPNQLDGKESQFNNSENISCEDAVNLASEILKSEQLKNQTSSNNEKIEEETKIGLNLFTKPDKIIKENKVFKKDDQKDLLENKENINDNAISKSLDQDKLANIVSSDDNKEKIKSIENESNLNEIKAPNSNQILSINKPVIGISESNSKIILNKPNEDKKEKRINIFKKTDITQGSSYDFIFKIALIGDSGIGKTSILVRFVDEVFKNDTTSTIGVDFKLVSFRIEDKLAKMQIWDTCGSERFKALTSSFIKSCSVFVIVFDLTKQKSFLNLENWIKLIKENVNPKLLCLVGNKADLEDQRQVTLDEAIKFSNKHELKYMETSARTNFGVEGLFAYIAEKLYDDTIRMRNIEKSNRKSKGNTKNSKAFELGPSTNIKKEEDNKNKYDSESDEENDEEKKKGKKISLRNAENAKKNKCNC